MLLVWAISKAGIGRIRFRCSQSIAAASDTRNMRRKVKSSQSAPNRKACICDRTGWPESSGPDGSSVRRPASRGRRAGPPTKHPTDLTRPKERRAKLGGKARPLKAVVLSLRFAVLSLPIYRGHLAVIPWCFISLIPPPVLFQISTVEGDYAIWTQMYRSPTPQLSSRSPSPFLSSNPNDYKSSLDDPNSPDASCRRPLAIASRSSNTTRNYVPGNTVSPPALNMKLSPTGIRSTPLSAISTEPITRFVSSRNDSSRDYLSLSRVSNSPHTNSFTRTSPSSTRAAAVASPDHSRAYESSLNSNSFESSTYSQSRDPSIYERSASPRPSRPLPQAPKNSYPSSSKSSINSNYSYASRAPTPTPQKSAPVINSRFRAFSDVTPGHTSKPPLKLDKKLLEHNLEALGSQSDLIPLSGALMSDVADRFLLVVPRQTHSKDSLEYQNSFTGKDIVVRFSP